jgi:hypothetical protein
LAVLPPLPGWFELPELHAPAIIPDAIAIASTADLIFIEYLLAEC